MNPIRKARVLRGFRQYQLAAKARLSPALLSGFERGRVIPRPDELAKIAAALGVGVDELRDDEAPQAGAVPRG